MSFPKLINFINSKKFWIAIALVFVISRLGTWFYPIDSDHWIFFYVGKYFAENGSLYTQAWDHKPPLIFLINGGMYFLLGQNIWLHRLFFTLISLIDILLFYVLLKKLSLKIFDSKFSADLIKFICRFGLLFYVFWRNLSQFTSSGNNTENFSLIFLFTMYLGHLAFLERKKFIWLFVSGIGLSGLVFLKPNFLIFSLPIWIEILISSHTVSKNLIPKLTSLIQQATIFITPVIIQLLAWLGYFYSQNSVGDFLFATIEFNAKYMRASWEGQVTSGQTFIVIILPTFILGLILAIHYKLTFKNLLSNKWIRFVSFWLLGSFIFASILGSFYTYYYLVVVPIISFLSLIWIAGFLNFQDQKNNSKLKLFNQATIVVMALVMVLNLAISYRQLYNFAFGRVAKEARENQQIADYIKNNSSPNDKIFANTYGATFYHLSDRDSGSRFISASVLLLDYREEFGYKLNDIFIQDMEKNQTKYVIMLKAENNLYTQNKVLTKYFKENYKFEKEFDTYEIWVRG